MKKFRYRLESLLKIKEFRERERQKEHGLALRKVQDQEHAIDRIDIMRHQTIEYQRATLSKPMSPYRLQACSRYFVKLKGDTMVAVETLRGLERKAEDKRLALVEASKEKQIYAKLKEKKRKAFYDEVEAREQKENDEIALTTFRRKRAG